MIINVDQRFDALHQLYTITDDLGDAIKLGLEMLHFDTGVISSIHGDTLKIEYCVSSSLKAGQTFPLSKTYCALPVKAGTFVKLDTTNHDDNVDEALQCERYLGIPLYVHNALYGVLHFSSASVSETSDEDVKFFTILAQWVSHRQTATLLKKTQHALHLSQTVAKLGYWRWTVSTNEVEWSEESYRLFGFEPYSVKPNYNLWKNMIIPEERERISQIVQDAVIKGLPYDTEYYIEKADGERLYIYSPGYPEFDEHGKVVALFGISQDITERKRAGERLKQSESALRASQKVAKLGHWRWHVVTNKVDWSEEHYYKHGYAPYSIEPDYYSWLNAVAPQDRERAHQIVSNAAQKGIPFETEYFIETPDGVQRYNYAIGYPEFDEHGKMISMFGIAQDITERKQLEDQLRDRTRDLEIAIEVSKQVAQILNVEELVSVIAERTRERFNFYHVSVFAFDEQEETLIYRDGSGPAAEIMKEERLRFNLQSREKGVVVQAAQMQKPVLVNDVENPTLPETRSELALPMLLGNRLIGVLDLQAKELNRFSPEDTRVLSSLAEQLAIALENARLYARQERVSEELRRVDKLKSQFLANMSHELRTPLNAILNFTHFVATEVFGPVNEEQRENLHKVTTSATHLLDLINDILDLSKIEAGMMNLFIEPVDLNPFMKSVASTAHGIQRAAGVELIIDIQSDLPVLSVDKRRIRQILLNLVSNASKFTEQGSITLTAKCQGDHVLFTVSDTGEGIETEHIDLIFEAFKQTEVGMSKGGTGLGLPISRYLAEAHGGKLWLTSEVGKGSTFYVSLPIYTDLVS